MIITVDTLNGHILYSGKEIKLDLLGALDIAPVGSKLEVVGRTDKSVTLKVFIANEQD